MISPSKTSCKHTSMTLFSGSVWKQPSISRLVHWEMPACALKGSRFAF